MPNKISNKFKIKITGGFGRNGCGGLLILIPEVVAVVTVAGAAEVVCISCIICCPEAATCITGCKEVAAEVKTILGCGVACACGEAAASAIAATMVSRDFMSVFPLLLARAREIKTNPLLSRKHVTLV